MWGECEEASAWNFSSVVECAARQVSCGRFCSDRSWGVLVCSVVCLVAIAFACECRAALAIPFLWVVGINAIADSPEVEAGGRPLWSSNGIECVKLAVVSR